ncbi:hypothetical protein [Winslowiella iniecta]|uniref:hypothetical protein n=1 Tax=Winslowiella iniecta TaxID=1560201 RepID=UPI000AE0308C|nr:hypothetical protein [Winslowiella iniecta]
MIEKVTALTATQNEPEKIDPEEQLPDQPDPELPDLARLYKRRCRDGDIMQKCKHLLIAGMLPGKVALLLRLPLEKVQNLYDNSYNTRCRRFAKTNAYTNARLALTSFNEGAMLAEICAVLGLPLFTIVRMLRDNNVSESAINARMPPADDPLCVEYRIVLERKAASKFKPIQLHSNRCKLHPTTAAITQQTSIQQASQKATA